MSECDPETLKRRLEMLQQLRPKELPDCWWVAIRYEDGTLELRSTHSSVASAEQRAELIREQSVRWLRQPEDVSVVKESPELTATSREGGWVPSTARWNWLERHAESLVSAAEPRSCRALFADETSASLDEKSDDILRHRLGGSAVLPRGVEWPTFDLLPEGQALWEMRSRLHESYKDSPFPGGTVDGTFLRTVDLRGKFSFGSDFPDALAVFVCTFSELENAHWEWTANMVPEPPAIVVPLFASGDPEYREPPDGTPELAEKEVSVETLPDFPTYGWGSCREVIKPTGVRSLIPFWPPQYEWKSGPMESTYDSIESLEPGTSGWISVDVSKIGGYPNFIQNDVLEKVEVEQSERDWYMIASLNGDILDIGDGGKLYILAGKHRRRGDWGWHCEMDCH